MKLPLLVTRDLITFPKFPLQFSVGRPQSIKTATAAYNDHNKLVLITAQLDPNVDEIKETNLYPTAILAKINLFDPNSSTPMSISVIGEQRVKLTKIHDGEVIYADYEAILDKNDDSKEATDIKDKLLTEIEKELASFPGMSVDTMIAPFANAKPSAFADSFAFYLPLSVKEKYALLGEEDVIKRMQQLQNKINELSGLAPEYNTSKVGQDANEQNVANDVNKKVNDKLQKQQREFMLREQLKQIEEELGEITGEENDVNTLLKQVEDNPYPKAVKEKLRKELRRLKATPSASMEYGIIRSYIDTVMEVPWWEKADEQVDIKETLRQLNEDHYGLEKPKERIVEYLAVKQKNPKSKGTILAFAGPPGTGKTSLANSIAKSLNRPIIKISLGGVKDESEIRGHRRTYIASMPGKIIQAMKKAGVTNPVILLDEIDKMSSDYKGDPTSAMLEVLDPEQNNKFQDNYLEEEYDLSNVMFIATANYMQNIPAPLIDRLEIIELSSYTDFEKTEIAKTHLIPKVLEETKLTKAQFKLSDKVLHFIIRRYTIEAGVRQLYRVLEKIARKIVVAELKTGKKDVKAITEDRVRKYLGIERFDYSKKDEKPQIGTTQGLAWTGYGGDILPIEVILYPGSGKLRITGQLKDVMTESAKIALSYIQANAERFGIKRHIEVNGEIKDIFKDFDIHVHSPDGATPKDGPSAGVTFTTSLISALSGKPVPNDIAMTGEITLRGKVFPIGGLKEKTIAAYRSGIKTVIVPAKNKRDLEEISEEAKKNLDIKLASTYEDVYDIVFGNTTK